MRKSWFSAFSPFPEMFSGASILRVVRSRNRMRDLKTENIIPSIFTIINNKKALFIIHQCKKKNLAHYITHSFKIISNLKTTAVTEFDLTPLPAL